MMEFKSLVPLLGFSTDFVPVTTADGLWGLNAQGVQFSSVGNITYNLTGGLDYQEGGGMTAGCLTSSLVMVTSITKMRLKSIT